ncbi:fibronectin type III domain-containing protein [Streptomyces fuscigenes]|uniref:fibronectin type III domain-containing protein n=1 Tax=Streptomyces fuscigenes TaxID=1528880 RepID=UPI001F403F69|nr:fibronectin type III domain-containing protein [Streptomyces fuscigenes]MCF3960799.1 fibronectin type III domain-containing protein [Streptomyces fuscigenes]
MGDIAACSCTTQHQEEHVRNRIAIAVAAAGVAAATIVTAGGAQADTSVTVRSGNFVSALSDTRANGHVTVGDNGIGVATVGTDSTAKAAEYWSSPMALADTGTPSLGWTGTAAEPGIQLVTDFDGDGKADAILVGEKVYGGDWWVSDSAAQFVKDGAPEHTGGSGSANHGTLAEWRTAFPKARVLDTGFSLGSGVTGSGIISKVVVGGTTFTFAGKDAPATIPTTAPTGVTVTSTNTSVASLKWTAVPGAESYFIYNGGSVVGASTGTTANVSGLKSNTGYDFSVAAVGAGSAGPKSGVVHAVTKPFTFTAPKGLKCTAKATALHCTATAVTGANRYGWYVNGIAHGSSDAPAYDIVSLAKSTTYAISVAADNDTQSPGPQSARVNYKTLAK